MQLEVKNLDDLYNGLAFRAVFEHSSLGIIISSTDGVIEKVNPFVAKIFGHSVSEMEGQHVEILLPHRLRENHVFLREGFLKDPKPRAMGVGLDLVAMRKDGSEFFIEASLSFYEINGSMHIVNFINDVTEEKKIKNDLEGHASRLEQMVESRTVDLRKALLDLGHSNEELQSEIIRRKEVESQVRGALKKEKELNELKSRFVSMASHEFRTPLGGILTSVSLLEKYTEPDQAPKRKKHIGTIKQSVKNLVSILNDFLSTDKLDQGVMENNIQSFKIKEFMDPFIQEFSELAEMKVEIKYIHEGDDFVLIQEKDMFRNVLNNLTSNAIKYTKEDVPIEVTTKREGDNLKLIIQDHGIGIPDEDQKYLFKRFFRASNASAIQGTGLGLNIVQRYLEYMGGAIEFESKQNIGTTFFVTIPMEKNE